MISGELDQRITIQTYTPTRGGSGQQIQTWTTFATRWAQVQTSGGSESFYNPQLVAESSHKLKLRYITGVKPTMRILWSGHTLDIIHVDESRKRQGELYILAREKVTP